MGHEASLIIGKTKSFFLYQGLIFREIRDLETGRSVYKYIFCIFSAFICSSIRNFPHVVGWLARELEILNGQPYNKSLKRHLDFLIWALRLSHMDNTRLVLIRKAGLDRFTMLALGPLSNESKDHDSHNSPLFLG